MPFGVGHFKVRSFVKGCKPLKIFVISSTDSTKLSNLTKVLRTNLSESLF